MDYIIADTHFGEEANGIIAYENRPYASKTEMIEGLVSNWNETVSDDDCIYHLGDVFGAISDEERKEIMARLKGHKYLVMGNHDRDHSMEYWMNLGFEKVYDLPIIYNGFLMMSHEPLYMNVGPYVNIFGHVHGNPMYKDVSEISYCASVERQDYRPVLIGQAMDKVREVRRSKNLA